MELLPLQQLADETLQSLINADASTNYQKIFKAVSRKFITYAEEHSIDAFSIEHGIQFLEDHYSMSQKMSEKKMEWGLSSLHQCNSRVSAYGNC